MSAMLAATAQLFVRHTQLMSVRVWLILVVSGLFGCADETMRTVAYRGEMFELSKTYASYTEYRDDPSNLTPSGFKRSVLLVKSVPVPQTFESSNQARTAFAAIKFPGYGLWTPAPQGSLTLYGVEIPGAGEIRWVTTVVSAQGISVVDDFVWAVSSGNIKRFELAGSQVRYLDAAGNVLREHGVMPNQTFQRTASPPLN